MKDNSALSHEDPVALWQRKPEPGTYIWLHGNMKSGQTTIKINKRKTPRHLAMRIQCSFDKKNLSQELMELTQNEY